MEAVIYFVVTVVSLAIGVLQLLMLIRAVLSWLPFDDSSPFLRFVTCATEPIILPVRNLLSRIEFFANLPFDLSFFIAYILLSIVAILLPTVKF